MIEEDENRGNEKEREKFLLRQDPQIFDMEEALELLNMEEEDLNDQY